MSHYTVLRTQISDLDTLVEALADMGFSDVEASEVARPLVGWLGDQREQLAEVIVRREHLGSASNDIGFRRQADGTFEALISEYDADTYDSVWLGQLSQRYAYRTARKALADQDFNLVEETVDATNTIRLTVRRMA